MGKALNLFDLESWVEYNYLVLSEKDQDEIQVLIKRQNRVRTIIAASFPVIGFSVFALMKYQFKIPTWMNYLGLCGFLVAYERAFSYGVKKEKLNVYSNIYESYKDQVNKKDFRGLKLYRGKHLNKIQDREYTTSNLDELKDMLGNQK